MRSPINGPTDTALKRRMNLIIAIIAAVVLARFAYRGLTRAPAQLAPATTAAACTPEAIRQVSDALERSVLSAHCARQDRDGGQQNLPAPRHQ